MEQIVRTPAQMGAALRRRRRSLGRSQSALGRSTTLRQATVSTVETGQPGTQFSTILELMMALDLEFVVRPRSTVSVADAEDLF